MAILALAALLVLPGCHRAESKEEKALRAELNKALHERAYDRAIKLARRHLKLRPQDNGTWDRLVQAQFGLRDLAGVKQTLDEWRRAVPKPAASLDEYEGDLAIEQQNEAMAAQVWSRILAADPKNARVLEKMARLEKARRRWPEEDAAWTALIAVQDTAIARINRALCRRHLHRWHDAFEDLQRAQALAPDDPEVVRGAKVLQRTDKFLADIREIDSALAISPKDAGLLADRALLFLRAEDPELALQDAEAASEIGTWAVRPKLFQALALIGLGRAAECERLSVNNLIRLESLPPESLETISRLDSEISAEPKNSELYLSRAWQLNEIGQPALALRDADTATLLDVKAAGAYAESSYALTKLGRGDEALAQIKVATEIDPNFSTAWQYRGELEMVRGELLSAIDSFTHSLEANQTTAALEKREQCYRRLGLLVKAEQDRLAREELARVEVKR